jgi:hypothetical protein
MKSAQYPQDPLKTAADQRFLSKTLNVPADQASRMVEVTTTAITLLDHAAQIQHEQALQHQLDRAKTQGWSMQNSLPDSANGWIE